MFDPPTFVELEKMEEQTSGGKFYLHTCSYFYLGTHKLLLEADNVGRDPKVLPNVNLQT